MTPSTAKKYTAYLTAFLDKKYTKYLLVSALGLLSPLAYAPYRHYWLMPLIFALLILITRRFPKKSVSLVYLWAFMAFLSQNYWIHTSLHDIAGMPEILALPLTTLFPLCLATFPALCFYLLNKLDLDIKIKIIWVLPLLWTLTEYLRSTLFTGFSWGLLAYSQIADSPLAGYAPIGGIFLVSYLTALVASLVVYVLLTDNRIKRTFCLSAIIVLVALGQHLHTIEYTTEDGTQAKIALIQGNIPQTLKFNEMVMNDAIWQYYEDVAILNQDEADIIILPETAIPIMREYLYEGILDQFAHTTDRKNQALAVGISQLTEDQKGYQNTVLNLSHYSEHSGKKAAFYAKNHLVPFGEFHPLPAITDWLYQWMNMPMSGFTPGGENQAPLHLGNQKIAFNICYEDSFGDELIHTARSSSLLANVSNMGWFGQSYAMDLQLQHSQARALEMGRYMVRATNNGMTAVIDPKGTIEAMIPRDTHQTLIHEIKGRKGETPYMKINGSRPLIVIMLIITLGFFGLAYFKKRQRNKS